jgi:nucleoid-associated protein YgaU
MGSVQQAVLEFDEEIQAPWRPRLVSPAPDSGGASPARPPLAYPSRRSPSRVGVCRPPAPPSHPVRRAVSPEDSRVVADGQLDAHRRPGPSRRPAASRPVPSRRAVASRPAPDPRASVRLRPTRRARRLAVVLALAGGVAVGSWVGPLLGGGGSALRLAGDSSVVVQQGDTLWSIASSLDGDRDVRAVVDEIQELNGLRGADVRPGQILLLP